MAMMFNPTDVRQVLYCPRVIYWTYVQPVPKVPTYKMKLGTETHQADIRADRQGRRRRKGLPEGERQYDVMLESKKLGLRGKVDMLITSNTGELFPVELKPSPRLEIRHQYQLVCYAMLVAEIYDREVTQAYIWSQGAREALPVTITSAKTEYVVDAVSRIRRIVETESFPAPTRGRGGAKCTDCEFRRYCGE